MNQEIADKIPAESAREILNEITHIRNLLLGNSINEAFFFMGTLEQQLYSLITIKNINN